MGNLGDDAILLSELSAISSRIPSAHFSVVGGSQWNSDKHLTATHVNILNPIGILRNMLACDLFMVGGGGLLKSRSAYFYSILLIVAKLLGKRALVCGVSSEKAKGPLRRFLLRIALSSCDGISVRGERSLRNVKELVAKNAVVRASDWVFLSQEAHKALATEERPYVVVNLKNWSHEDLKEVRQSVTEDALLACIAESCRELAQKHGVRFVLVPLETQRRENDFQALAKLRRAIQDLDVNLLDHVPDIDKLVELIRYAELLIAERVHAIIFATIARTPFVALSYSDKVAEISPEGMAIDLRKFECLNFRERIIDCWERREALKALLADEHNRQQVLARRNLDMVIDVLNN